jgi:hypothetical protein
LGKLHPTDEIAAAPCFLVKARRGPRNDDSANSVLQRIRCLQEEFETLQMETLKLLCEYFPTAVFTGKCLVFISEDWRVELTEHKDSDFSKSRAEPSIIRIRIFKRAMDGELIAGHYEDFQLASLGELAEQIEKYVQMAIGTNLRENIE